VFDILISLCYTLSIRIEGIIKMYAHDVIMNVYDTLYSLYVSDNKSNVSLEDKEIIESILASIMIMYHEALEEFDSDMDNMYNSYGGSD